MSDADGLWMLSEFLCVKKHIKYLDLVEWLVGKGADVNFEKKVCD